LSESLAKVGAKATATAARFGAGPFGLVAGEPRSTSDGAAPAEEAEAAEWNELMRYFHLLMAVQAERPHSWEPVLRLAEQIRDMPWGGNSAEAKTEEGGRPLELEQVRASRWEAARETEACEAEVQEVVQAARAAQSACEQLKFRLSLVREAAESERRRLAEHGDKQLEQLQRDEARLKEVTEELERLRAMAAERSQHSEDKAGAVIGRPMLAGTEGGC
jgi:hypothetical protein